MTPCTKCNDTGYKLNPETDQLIECSCKLRKELKAWLPPMFSNYPIVKKFNHKQFVDKNICYKGDLKKFGAFINTYLTHRYLLNRNYTYDLASWYGFLEKFFDLENNRFYEADLMILLVYGGYKNKIAEDKLPSLLKDRILTNKQTIVFVDTSSYSDSKIREYMGVEFLNLINEFTPMK